MIYFIKEYNSHYVKIGFTVNPIRYRLGGIQSGNPRRLIVLKTLPGATKADEKFFHKHFENTRIRGEWFEMSPLIESVAACSSLKEAKERCLKNEH